jgi:hypothetical protein
MRRHNPSMSMERTLVFKLNRALNRILGGPRFDKSTPIHPLLGPWYKKKALEVWHEHEGELRQRKLRTFHREIDFDVLRAWRHQCHEFHGLCCNDRYSDGLSKYMDEIHLVDVVRGCLVTVSSATPYVALSYVWGKVPMLKTTKTNIDQLRREGALFDDGVARTIRDAMHVVKRLDERYLWVDCLCIAQDSEAHEMDSMLQAMGHIYASAEFTIAAASGDNANHGISGVGGSSQPRDSKFQGVHNDLGLHQDDYQSYKERAPWTGRGWTFQESLFSRRLLVFDTVVTWMCGRVVQHECFEDTTPPGIAEVDENTTWPAERPHLGFPMGMMSLIPKVPSLGRWGMLVEDYSSRDLTYPQDAARAFAGATEIIGATFPDGIIHGLPLFFFDIAMLWVPLSYHVNDTTRRAEGPSWSWTGWKAESGVICWNRWHPHLAGIYRATGDCADWMTIAPLRPVATYQAVSAEGETPYAIHFNRFYAYQALRVYPPEYPLPGWKRHEHVDGHYYTQQHPDGDTQRFPFPLPTAAESQAPLPADVSPTLLCTAPLVNAWFEALPAKDETSHGMHYRFLIYTEYGSANFYLASRIRFDVAPDARYTLVALSEARVQDLERLINGRDRYNGYYHYLRYAAETGSFYNVLWVEWEGDVARRKTLGVMSSREWEALGPASYTFRLG